MAYKINKNNKSINNFYIIQSYENKYKNKNLLHVYKWQLPHKEASIM